MKKITLQVNKYYFNLIKNKELLEDYRAIKEYWIKKLVKEEYNKLKPIEIVKKELEGINIFKTYDKIIFKNGYKKDSSEIEVIFKDIRFTKSYEITCMGKGIAFAIKIEYP